MAKIKINEGDSIEIVFHRNVNTEYGVAYMTSTSKEIPWTDVKKLISGPKRKKRKTTKAGYLGRIITLTHRALKTGEWTTGSTIKEINSVLETLIKPLGDIKQEDAQELSVISFDKMEEIKEIVMHDPRVNSDVTVAIHDSFSWMKNARANTL